MSYIPGLEIYDLKFDEEIDLGIFNKEENADKITTLNEPYRKVKSIYLKQYDLELLTKIQKEISRCLEDYKNKYKIEINSYEELIMIEYSEGGHFDDHTDDDGYGERSVSMIIYLNDNYNGGELEFTNFDKNIGKIKPKKNQLFLFPSNYIYRHAAHPITNGKKYIMLTFFSKHETRTYRPFSVNYSDIFTFKTG